MALIEPLSCHFISQRLRLHYVTWGNRENPVLLLLHGARDHCRNWDDVAAAFYHDWYVVAPDLRGHGDSEWSSDGSYSVTSYVYDLVQLIRNHLPKPLTIVAHSMGGNIALRYTGLYPDSVRRLVAAEGLYPPRGGPRNDFARFPEKMRHWIDKRHNLSSRVPRRYATLKEAIQRMKSENGYLSEAQLTHLTTYGVVQNEDGSFSWKFDNYVRLMSPVDISDEEERSLWSDIKCPTLLVHGRRSWVPDPALDGRMSAMNDAQIAWMEASSHWPQHDQTDAFINIVKTFIAF